MRATLDRLYREHRQGLYTLALSILRDPSAAEDAVHEAFSRLCSKRVAPTGDPVSYVFAAVRNASIDLLRRRPGAVLTGVSIFDECVSPVAGPGRQAEEAERDRMLREAVESLPDDQRQAVVMKLYGGLTFEQIAQTLGEPLSTVSTRYRKALDVLRETLEVNV